MICEERMIVLRKIKHGESDAILHGLTRQGAKMSFFARGAYNSKKRFGGGVLEPTHYIKIQFKESKQEEGLHRLEDAKLLESFERLRLDYERLNSALYFITVIEKVCKEGTVDSTDLFDLLGNSLRSAETSNHLPLLRLHFQTRLLAAQGVLPPIDQIDSLLEFPIKEHENLDIDGDIQDRLRVTIEKLLDQYIG